MVQTGESGRRQRINKYIKMENRRATMEQINEIQNIEFRG